MKIYVESISSGPPILENPFVAGFGKIVQGSLEVSNVNVVQELVDMIKHKELRKLIQKQLHQ